MSIGKWVLGAVGVAGAVIAAPVVFPLAAAGAAFAGPASGPVSIIATRIVPHLITGIVGNFAESFIDNVLREKVSQPAIGGVVYCDLAFAVEHSGIYIGGGNIIHLDGSGRVEKVSAHEFIRRLGGWNNAISIYTACSGTVPAGLVAAAAYAKRQVGRVLDYGLVAENCHRFTASCLMGKKAPVACNTLTSVKALNFKNFGISSWRIWDCQ